MPNNLSILRDLGRARRERPVDQGPVSDFEPISIGDYLLGRYLADALPAFLQPRLRQSDANVHDSRDLQSLLLTTRIHASANAAVKQQIEQLAANAHLPIADLARAAASVWYAQLNPAEQAALRRRFTNDIIHLGPRLHLSTPRPMPGFLRGLLDALAFLFRR